MRNLPVAFSRFGTISVIRDAETNRKAGVKELPRSNIYEAGAASIAELFADHLENPSGNRNGIALAVSTSRLAENARGAIEKSLAALGYGQDACMYATLAPVHLPGVAAEADAAGAPAPDAAPGSASAAATLDAQALFLLVEGLDPLFVIACDNMAVRTIGAAYRADFAPDSAIRVFGRPAAAFRDLASLIETDAGKQKAWRLFKTFPKR